MPYDIRQRSSIYEIRDEIQVLLAYQPQVFEFSLEGIECLTLKEIGVLLFAQRLAKEYGTKIELSECNQDVIAFLGTLGLLNNFVIHFSAEKLQEINLLPFWQHK
ncbi:hypothetical protein [Pseudanabaena sp. UWO310]|uniref:hypothetical protein n=1 Tax=Pseudanabaena sp. UWO310 TaxID=2480795 RepID=UPI0011578BED|nr:hypothetical protein [Pseudanabaena sp. UWO310]TYQ28156.1 hypothetical protein PseudUWO310_14540 [Pseudanabaena sp. UWO310]